MPSSTDDEPEARSVLTRERAKELCAELSLIDLCRLLLTKAAGSEGLSAQGGSRIDVESGACKLTLVRRAPKKAKRVKPG